MPFTVGRHGAAELRRRVITASPRRPDAGVAYYFAIQPFAPDLGAWPSVLAALASAPAPTTLSIGFQPTPVDPSLSRLLDDIATRYEPLARPGRRKAGVYAAPEDVAPDPFAVDAVQSYRDAARRLSGQVFRLSVRVASEDALHPPLLRALTDALAGAHPARPRSAVSAEFQASPVEVRRPEDAGQLAVFGQNLASLGFERWGEAPIWSSASPPPAALRTVAELVDSGEALAVARFPAAVDGVLPGFPVRRPGSSRRRIFLSYRSVDSGGFTRALHARLAAAFGDEAVFMDKGGGLSDGDVYRAVIADALSRCDVVLAVIGPHWLTVADEDGRARIDKHDDVLAGELELALTGGKQVIPVLVDGATMPTIDELPRRLRPLEGRHARQATPGSFDRDVDDLIEVLARLLQGAEGDGVDGQP